MKDDKIKELPTLKHRASESTVTFLKDMLAKAESGEVTEVALVGLCADGNVHCWATPLTKTFQILGALEQLKFDILEERSLKK